MQQSCTSQAECDPKWLFEIGSSFTGSRAVRRIARRDAGPVKFRNQRQRLPCGLPIFGIVFCLGQFSDVMCGVAERGSSQCARFEIILERLEGWRQEQVTWFLAIPYLPKVMR